MFSAEPQSVPRPFATARAGRVLLLAWALIALGGLLEQASAQVQPGRRGRQTPPIEQGFVFVDGQFVAGPYQLEYSSEGLKVNGHLVFANQPKRDQADGRSFYQTAAWDNPPEGQRNPSGDQRRRGWPPPGNMPGPPQRPHMGLPGSSNSIAEQLSSNGLLVLFEDQPAVALPHSQATNVLRVMVRGPEARTPQSVNNLILDSVLDTLPQYADREAWRAWLTNFEANEVFLSRAKSIVEEIESVEKANYAELAASQRLQDWAYPLTVFGMLMGVLSLGHLLQSPPKPAYLELNEQQKTYLARAVIYSLVFIIVLSALDLAWTVLASQAGQMAELNPIGSHLIENSFLLTLFKAGATLMSCGILLALRHHERAQWAAWWLCLILTLLTFRWLVLNSMFVG